jgi:hypothetical protein
MFHHFPVQHQIRFRNFFNLPRSSAIKETDEELNIKFLVKAKKTSTETFNLLRETYGKDGRVSKSTLTK